MFKSTPLIQNLETEARAVIEASFRRWDNLALLFSGGKDSTLLFYLVSDVAKKLNRSFQLIHIDTGFNFPEILQFRDQLVESHQASIIVKPVTETDPNKVNRAQSLHLNQVIADNGFDIVFGGGRRDEDKARQKELFFSRRKNGEGWKPETPEVEIGTLGGLFKNSDEHFRVFPFNNWTEFDIWTAIGLKNLPVCSLYFSHERQGQACRFRTIGDQTNSAPIASTAKTPFEVAMENKKLQTLERDRRKDDQFSEYAMEIRKKEGYF